MQTVRLSMSTAPWKFIHVADIHVGSPRSYRFQPAWNENWQTARRQIVARKPELLLVGGDLTRDGSTHVEELEAINTDLDSLPFPAHVIPGNHEVGNKYSDESPVAIQEAYVERYAGVFGPSRWSLEHRRVRFTGCDAFLLGSGLPQEDDLRHWLEQLPALLTGTPDDAQTSVVARAPHVWMLHPALFADQFDEPDFDRDRDRVAWYFSLDSAERRYLFDIMKRAGVTDVISAHIHCRRHVVVDGIRIHFAPATAFSQWGDRWPDGDPALGFLEFTVHPAPADHSGTITWQFVPLTRQSTAEGYGPGGNPPVEGRDYTASWEKPSFRPAG